jgi:hypothetical protein
MLDDIPEVRPIVGKEKQMILERKCHTGLPAPPDLIPLQGLGPRDSERCKKINTRRTKLYDKRVQKFDQDMGKFN